MKRLLSILTGLLLAVHCYASGTNVEITADKFTLQLVGSSVSLFNSNKLLLGTALSSMNVTGHFFSLNGVTITNWTDIIGNITGLNSNNIAPGGISVVNLNSNAVDQTTINPLSGVLFIANIRAPDGLISNTTALSDLFTITQGGTNIVLNNTSQQSWVDVTILFDNTTGSSVTFSNTAFYTNDFQWQGPFPPVVIPARSGFPLTYTQTFSPGIFPATCNFNVKSQPGTAAPGVTMQLMGVHVLSVVHH